MLDFSVGELGLIGIVALVVLGPERLPKVARTVGAWVGKAQRYVNQVKVDINREIELSELKQLQDEARSAAQTVEASLRDAVGGAANALGEIGQSIAGSAGHAAGPGVDSGIYGGLDVSAAGRRSHLFERRYKPGPSIDQLADEVVRLRRELALPSSGAPAGARGKYRARARVSRPRIRR